MPARLLLAGFLLGVLCGVVCEAGERSGSGVLRRPRRRWGTRRAGTGAAGARPGPEQHLEAVTSEGFSSSVLKIYLNTGIPLLYFNTGQGPKYVKIFINLPRSMDFEEAERSEPTQALELTADDIKEDGIIQLRYVKFQNVNSVTVSTSAALRAQNFWALEAVRVGF